MKIPHPFSGHILYLTKSFAYSVLCSGFRTANNGGATAATGKPQKHVLVVKMSLAITICFFISMVGVTVPFFFNLSDKFVYCIYLNNISNPIIYYWLNKEFRKEYNDIWQQISSKLCG